MGDLTANFSWWEVSNSATAQRLGINNMLPSSLRQASENTAQKMETVRQVLEDVAIHVDSWYRCLPLNTALKSKPTSQHLLSEAVDFIAPSFGTPSQIVRALIAHTVALGFDQIILEFSWVHISFCAPGITPRNSILTLMPDGTYSKGIAK